MKTLWPRFKGVIVRELRANTSPVRASFSLALGILIGFSPFYGLHFATLIPLTYLLRLNRPLALLAVSITSLPVVPFWVAAGIFTGRLTIPIAWCECIVDRLGIGLSGNGPIAAAVAFFRGFFPDALFGKIQHDGHGLAAGFIQWALGSCVLAIVSAALTFAVAYPLLLRRHRKQHAGAGA